MSYIPTIRVELDGVKQTVVAMLSERDLDLKAKVAAALDKELCSEHLDFIIGVEASKVIVSVVSAEVRRVFVESEEGKKAIHAEVTRRLKAIYPLNGSET